MSCLCRACFSAKVAKCSSLLSGLPVGAELGEVSGKWGRETGICCYCLQKLIAIVRNAGGGEAICSRNSPE